MWNARDNFSPYIYVQVGHSFTAARLQMRLQQRQQQIQLQKQREAAEEASLRFFTLTFLHPPDLDLTVLVAFEDSCLTA